MAGCNADVNPSTPLRNVPGTVCAPGAELVRRIRDVAPDPETLVVVNCAGRTRSIIGAQSLIDAGAPNRTVALENGTMDWTLADLALKRGASRSAPPPSQAARDWARAAAARSPHGSACAPSTPEPLPAGAAKPTAARSISSTCTAPTNTGPDMSPEAVTPRADSCSKRLKTYAPVRGARMVLTDDDGVRATMTASWLLRMGWRDVRVFAAGDGGDGAETGPEPARVLGLTPARRAFEIDAVRVAGMLPGRDMTLVDFAGSRRFRQGHIPGAHWGLRSRLSRLAARLPEAAMAVLTSPDSLVAHLAVPELGKMLRCPVRVLRGATDAWKAAGFPLETGAAGMLDDTDDDHPAPYDLPPARAGDAMRAYLDWETALPARIARDGAARFRVRPPDAV